MMNTDTTTEGLRKLNKDLLIRNAELVKKLNRTKTERDNFEQLFIDWKKINKDASEALNLLQKDKQKCEEENIILKQEINEYKLEIKTLKLQNNERNEQCNHLLSTCNKLKKQLSNGGYNNNNSNNNINTLKFNYQQKKNEIDQILYEIQKLFNFCHTNYPSVISNVYKYQLNDIKEYENMYDNTFDYENEIENENENYIRKKPKKKTRDFKKKKHRTTKSLSHFDKQIFEKRRSLNYIYDKKKKNNNYKKEKDNNNNYKNKKREKKQKIVITPNTNTNTNSNSNINDSNIDIDIDSKIDSKITPELLGPKTSYHQYDTNRTDPFGRTQSSHSFFHNDKYRYNKVQLSMNSNINTLWNKRDSLSRKKKKQPRINAIPSSAGTTPLTTPQQSLRGKLSDDSDENIPFYNDKDPHQKYLEMMDEQTNNIKIQQQQQQQQSQPTQTKLTDKKAIHDLFDMLQQQTLTNKQQQQIQPQIQPQTDTHSINDIFNQYDQYDNHYDEQQNQDAQLVPLPEPSDSSSDSD